MVDAALEHAAAMAMGANGDAILANSIEDELCILRLQVVQALLNDVVAVQVLNQLDDLVSKRKDDCLDL